jgi:hypothetical protein
MSSVRRQIINENGLCEFYYLQVGHKSGRYIVELLQKEENDLDDEDIGHMRKVVGYVHRHMAQGPSKRDVENSKWRFSLMNW